MARARARRASPRRPWLRPGGLGAPPPSSTPPSARARRSPSTREVGVVHGTVGPRRGAGAARPRGRRQARDINVSTGAARVNYAEAALKQMQQRRRPWTRSRRGGAARARRRGGLDAAARARRGRRRTAPSDARQAWTAAWIGCRAAPRFAVSQDRRTLRGGALALTRAAPATAAAPAVDAAPAPRLSPRIRDAAPSCANPDRRGPLHAARRRSSCSPSWRRRAQPADGGAAASVVGRQPGAQVLRAVEPHAFPVACPSLGHHR